MTPPHCAAQGRPSPPSTQGVQEMRTPNQPCVRPRCLFNRNQCPPTPHKRGAGASRHPPPPRNNKPIVPLYQAAIFGAGEAGGGVAGRLGVVGCFGVGGRGAVDGFRPTMQGHASAFAPVVFLYVRVQRLTDSRICFVANEPCRALNEPFFTIRLHVRLLLTLRERLLLTILARDRCQGNAIQQSSQSAGSHTKYKAAALLCNFIEAVIVSLSLSFAVSVHVTFVSKIMLLSASWSNPLTQMRLSWPLSTLSSSLSQGVVPVHDPLDTLAPHPLD